MANKRMISAVVVLTSVAAASLFLLYQDPFRRLVRASPRDARVAEARLSGGFPWAPLQSATRSAEPSLSRPQVRLASVVYGVLDAAKDDADLHSRHAAAVALFLSGKSRQAMTQLADLAATPDADAKVWNDLAAVRNAVAVTENEPSLLAEGLAAADTALRFDPDLVEALFNRALILDKLGLRDQARAEWEKYIAADSGTEWANEARAHARELSPITPFKQLLENRFEALAADPAAAQQLARSQPQDARRFGETKILGQWADAEKAGDSVTAEKNLRLARAFGAELARYRGEKMLERAVAAIDQADPARRQHLIDGHILFRDGQRQFMDDRTAVAQRTLENAARELELGGSPLALVAHYFIAHTYHGLGNLLEARRREEQLLLSAPAEFPAHRAQLLWHIGLGHMSDGEWGKAMTAFTESVSIFERIEELDFATTVRGLMAEVYERIGDPGSAWEQRIIALHEIGKTITPRLQMSLDSVGRGAIIQRQWPVALSFIGLAGDLADRIEQPAIQVEMHLLQARVNAQMHTARAAATAIALARTAASKLDDAAMREDATAEIVATEAIVAAQPNEAVALLTKAIDYHLTRGRRVRVPEMLLARARAFSRMGDAQRAAADLETGITEVERSRESLPRGEQRWGIFQTADELFEEAIALALTRDDLKGAFAYSERARARDLLDSLAISVSPAPAPPIALGTAIVEYVALPDRLVMFVVDNDGIAVAQHAVSRIDLEREAAQFTRALETGAQNGRLLGATLHQRLIASIEIYLTGKKRIVFVPGPSLVALPFAALRGRDGGYLVERYALVNSPSAAVYARLSSKVPSKTGERHLLVVANPISTEGVEALPQTEREAGKVAAQYDNATQLIGTRASPAEFRRLAPEARFIHLATHGVVPAGTRGSAALLLTGGRLGVSDIAALPFAKAHVVVLAACSSARGVVRAEGTISVARAFLAAGVPSVTATLWPIDDMQSAEFFPRLHRHLAAGTPPAEALRMAQIESIGREDSPAFWAAVQCIGS